MMLEHQRATRPMGWGVLVVGMAFAMPVGPAAAQDLRAGVPIGGLVPDGLSLTDVSVPDGPGAVKLFLADGRQGPRGASAVSVEILVAASRSAAEEWVAFQRTTVGATNLPRAAIGEDGRGDDGLVLFRRDNVGVRVQRMAPGLDARTLAAHVDERILAAPVGTPDPEAVPELALPEELERDGSEGRAGTLRLGPGLLAARVQVDGPGYARKTREGWEIVRTGPGPLRVAATRVDMKLVVAR